jgi:hydroxyacylglutathione hydrolase
MLKVDKNRQYFVHCAGGYRSMIFLSVLKARGDDNLADVKGGLKAIKETGKIKLTDYVCPTTQL